jgi:hypothetical protein
MMLDGRFEALLQLVCHLWDATGWINGDPTQDPKPCRVLVNLRADRHHPGHPTGFAVRQFPHPVARHRDSSKPVLFQRYLWGSTRPRA